MKLRVAGAAGATASATAPAVAAVAAPPPPPPSQTPPPPPPSTPPPAKAASSPDTAEANADCPTSCPASGSTTAKPEPTPRARVHRILAAPRATKAWFRLSLAWLRRTQSDFKPSLNNLNTTRKHNSKTASAADISGTNPSPATITPTSSTSTFTTASTAACTSSTANTTELSESLNDTGMRSRYSNTSADSGVVPPLIHANLPSTSQQVCYEREPPLWGKPDEPFMDSDYCCDPTVAVPTVEQCMEVISVPPNSTLMHSGGVHSSGALRKVLEENRDYLRGYTPLSFKHISRDFSQLYANVPRAWSSLSTALATVSSGVVYVLLPEGAGTDDFPPGGHFSLNEWPYLGENVTHVIRINENNQNREVIYIRRDQLSYERQPTPEPQPDPDPPSDFGYPLTPCPSSRTNGLRPPAKRDWKLNISPDGTSFRAGPDFCFSKTSDERSRVRPSRMKHL